jgi:hypothetical protein
MGQDLVHSLTELISWGSSTHAGGKGLLRSVWGDKRLMGLSALLVPAVSPECAQSVSAGLSMLRRGTTVGAT